MDDTEGLITKNFEQLEAMHGTAIAVEPKKKRRKHYNNIFKSQDMKKAQSDERYAEPSIVNGNNESPFAPLNQPSTEEPITPCLPP